MQEWCTIESDPGVFTELINTIGVQGVQVEEIYDLNDEQQMAQMQPIYGFIFLFRWTSKGEKRECLKIYDQDLFFANQVIQNACATQAIISILLNCPQIEIGEALKNYKEFAIALDPKERGNCLGAVEVIKTAHNSFARPEPFIFSNEKKKAKEGDDIFHFVSYIPFKGKVYELDGLQEGPILIGEYQDDWIVKAKEAILKRIQHYQEKETAFTLLAVNQCRKFRANQIISQSQNEILLTLKTLEFIGADLNEEQKQQLIQLSNQQNIEQELLQESKEELLNRLNLANTRIQEAQITLSEENAKFQKFKEENSRRKHNYIPFILELFKMAQRKGQLEGLLEKAQQKQQQKLQQQQKK
ncbi:unnamed protein product [Paramecium pentaurelia]|uniref:Ubiquitin carboxyl-terminal hydrolase n=1 Tax=Paramecium pentaurelia TaxID=43138 RepID=A0A8S1VKF9_9CILI|nr:unnamed protein product [Paramecium pentaurelia]